MNDSGFPFGDPSAGTEPEENLIRVPRKEFQSVIKRARRADEAEMRIAQVTKEMKAKLPKEES